MIKLASRPGAAPGKLSFGDSAAQAGARLKKKKIGAVPRIALGQCPSGRTSVAGRHSAVESQPLEIKGPAAFSLTLPARAI
jgi:hypothetical protein